MSEEPIGGSPKAVTSAGTAEKIVASKTMVTSVVIVAKTANTGNVFVGQSSVDSTNSPLEPGDSYTRTSDTVGGTPIHFDLNQMWVDSAVSGEGIDVFYDGAW